jgi:NAD(P)-dependent dehydrogenase (short-subunit alcohol dehydrogenase family)
VLTDRVVVVTGGAGLIGQEFVRVIVENGGIAIIADIEKEQALIVRKKLSQQLDSQNINVVELDITSKVSLNKAISYLDKKYGRIDALVNNAYPRNNNFGRHFFDVEYEDFIQNVGLNLGGYFTTSQVFSRYFEKQGYGNIINIASIYGVIAPKFEIYNGTSMTVSVEYAAIKSGLIHLTKYMAKYFKGMNIRVNTLSPGGILDTQPKVFLKAYKAQCSSVGMLDKKDINGSLLYLLSDLSKYVNGQNIVVDDGFIL